MSSPSSTSIDQTVTAALAQNLDLAARETRDFDVDGRVVTVHGAGTDVTVISSDGQAVVLRRQPDGRFVVTGASARRNASESLDTEDAIRVALTRLDR